MTDILQKSPLGKATGYCDRYDPSLLFPIARSQSRNALSPELVYAGVDIWTAYEISWLNPRGLPQVAGAEFMIPADSENIIESKSFKLYLNSFNQTAFATADEVKAKLIRDLSAVAAAPVAVKLLNMSQAGSRLVSDFSTVLGATSLDDQDILIDTYQPQPEYLKVLPGEEVSESLYSDLLKSNCPVTGQPDWASICLEYQGQPIDRAGLLRYLVSFRQHQGFHEHCVERIFSDLMQRCAPRKLSVYARYTRRGGLDINPFRSTDKHALPPELRLWRQ